MRVERIVMPGRHVRLEPLSAAHAPALARHHDPAVFAYLGRGAPDDASVDAMRRYVEKLNAEPNRFNWAIRVLENDDVAGRISFIDARPAQRALEIGTMIMTPYQGTLVNPEAKYLMLRHAFEDLGAIRVQFKVDARNARSQRAIEKLGATREGVLRKAQVLPDGHVRDSVVYSVLDDEWPRVKAGLEARLEPRGEPA